MADQSVRVQRRVDLDWIRIIAFGLLIFYHVGMVFVPWYYHVKSAHSIASLEPFMLAVNPWRLCLLFLVAGAATRFMATTTAVSTLLRRRSARLLVPLLFGILVIVPPQSYWEVVSRHLYSGSFPAFYTAQYFSFAPRFCSAGACLLLPTWNHLWFVAYLWVYTTALVLLTTLLPEGTRRIEAGVTRALSGLWLIVLPAIAFSLYRAILYPMFPETNALIGDWYNHALYFSVFALGFLIAPSEIIQAEMARWRWTALAIAIGLFAFHVFAAISWPEGSPPPHALQIFQPIGYGIYQWCSIVAALGFARHANPRDSRARRYLTDAIFPYYIVHQTAIVGTAFALRGIGLPAWQEAAIIIVVTVASCALSYEVIKRVGWLRPLFGLKWQASAIPRTANIRT